MAFVIIGSLLWKKANRFDPASEKDNLKFFIQNHLGTIISVIAFLPLVILIFTNKDMDGKQKGIVGAIAVVTMLFASGTGSEIEKPLATVVARGLITSTLLTLLIIPSVYSWFEKGKVEVDM